jgi:uncharacterized membrane protein YfcA
MQYAVLLLVGLAAGLLGGFVGVGGGIIMVPALVMLLGYSQLKAQGTSLGVLCLPVSLLGFLQYWKNPDFRLDLWAIATIALGFLAGGYFGGRWANQIDPLLMRKLFAGLLVIVAVYLFMKK